MKVTKESLKRGLKKCKLLEEDTEMMEKLDQDAQEEFDRENKEYWLERRWLGN